MNARLLGLALVVALHGCMAGDGMRFQVISMERPPEGIGLPPPPDYQPCYWGEARAYDRNGDGRFDQSWTFDPTRKGCATIAGDKNGDGKPDPGTSIDICQQLSDGGR